jgi:hypothetical protein
MVSLNELWGALGPFHPDHPLEHIRLIRDFAKDTFDRIKLKLCKWFATVRKFGKAGRRNEKKKEKEGEKRQERNLQPKQ